MNSSDQKLPTNSTPDNPPSSSQQYEITNPHAYPIRLSPPIVPSSQAENAATALVHMKSPPPLSESPSATSWSIVPIAQVQKSQPIIPSKRDLLSTTRIKIKIPKQKEVNGK